MFRIITLLAAVLWTVAMPAQKQLKSIRTFLKNKNANEAMRVVQECEKDSALRLLPKLYEYGKQAQMLINDEQNEKIYLKQSYDTLRFFSSTQGIYDYILKCRNAELYQLAQTGAKPKYGKSNARLLREYHNNIGAAGRFLFSKGKYDEAFRYLNTYLTIPTDEMWGTERDVIKSVDYRDNAFLFLQSAYRTRKYEHMMDFAPLLMADTTYRCRTMEYLALSASEKGDTAAYYERLTEGLREYPLHMFFFTRLADLYAANGRFEYVVLMADSLLRTDSTNLFYLEAKCVSHLNLQQYPECVEAAKRSLAVDSTLTDTYYYAGLAYTNMAGDVPLPPNINSRAYRTARENQRRLYALARPYVERFRTLKPEAKDRWAPLLYRIYFNLNEGKLFDEIERIMNGSSSK